MSKYDYPKPLPCKCGHEKIVIETGRAKSNLTGIGHWCRCRKCEHYGPFRADKMGAIKAWDEESVK